MDKIKDRELDRTELQEIKEKGREKYALHTGEKSTKVGRTRVCSCPTRPSASLTKLVLLLKPDWIVGTATPRHSADRAVIKWHCYPTYRRTTG